MSMGKGKKMSLMEVKDRIKFIRNLTGMSQAAFASYANISLTTYKSWESGKRLPSTQAIKKCLDSFESLGVKVSTDWVLNSQGNIPQLHASICNQNIDKTNPNLLLDIPNELQLFSKLYKDFVHLEIYELKMLPIYSPGDIVGGIILSDLNINKKLLDNKDCIIKLSNGSIVLRKVLFDMDQIALTTTNSFQKKQEISISPKIEWIAPVFWHRKKIG